MVERMLVQGCTVMRGRKELKVRLITRQLGSQPDVAVRYQPGEETASDRALNQ